MKRGWKAFFIVTGAAAAAVIGIIAYVQLVDRRLIRSFDQVQPTPYAIVLGASVTKAGVASDALRDRVETAVQLYQQGKVQRFLMTGDDGEFHVDEVAAMKQVALQLGVPSSTVEIDPHGYRTYESCKRAAEVYHIKQAIIVTQNFHLGRALYLCKHFGLDVQGVSADLHAYQRIVFFTLRDWLASFKAWVDVNVLPPSSPVKFIESTSTSL